MTKLSGVNDVVKAEIPLCDKNLNKNKKMQNDIIKVLIVESLEVIRLGLRTLIESQSSLSLVDEADCLNTALDLTARYEPDVVILDLLLNDGNCIENIPKLLDACASSKILVFADISDEQEQLHVLRLGAMGIIAKHQPAQIILKAIYAIHANQVWFDKSISKLLWQAHANNQPFSTVADAQKYGLTKQEHRIACLAVKGLGAKKIGDQLLISEKTVRNHLTVIYEKFGVGGQVELCLKASQLGFSESSIPSRNKDKYPEKK